MVKACQIVVKGRVQGVFFRASTKDRANQLNLVGFVQNLDDGSVYIECEGQEEDVQSLIDWCKKGPPMSKVTDVLANYKESTSGSTGFFIKRF